MFKFCLCPLPPKPALSLSVCITICIHPESISQKEKNNKIHNMGSESGIIRKPRVLCLHGFRSSARIMKKQICKWPQSLLQKLDLVFADAPVPCQGKSDVEGIFDPPYYEWFQFNLEFTDYTNFDECLKYIEDFMIQRGPFDGLLGFSQGAILAAGLVGLREKGVALTRVPKVKFLILMSAAKFKAPSVAEKAYSSPISCPTLHFLGEADILRPLGAELVESCIEPVVIKHPEGHTIPTIDDASLKTVTSFVERVQKLCDTRSKI